MAEGNHKIISSDIRNSPRPEQDLRATKHQDNFMCLCAVKWMRVEFRRYHFRVGFVKAAGHFNTAFDP